MINEVVLDNKDTGWDLETLLTFRTFDGVLRVNGEELLASGRFRFARLSFASEEDASRFAQASAKIQVNRQRSG